MKYIIILLIFSLLIPLINAETTFFDNPNIIFVLGNPATEAAVNEGTGGTGNNGGGGGGGGGGTSCVHKWDCTEWSECSSAGKQARSCVNTGTCSNAHQPPATEQDCNVASSQDEGESIIDIITQNIPDVFSESPELKLIFILSILVISTFLVIIIARGIFKIIIAEETL